MEKIVCWWSGGITSAVACKLAIDLFGKGNCRVIFMDTCNEHPDTYRFFVDCEKWYGIEIEIITAIKDYKHRITPYKNIFNERHQYIQTVKNIHFKNIQDVWLHFNSLNVSYGAICSTVLKRELRIKWQKENKYKHQVFGFEFIKRETNRALSLHKNYPKAKAIYPLLMMAYDKEKCIDIVSDQGIKVPDAYLMGYNNNNCLGEFGGCVQGGIGYWQKMYRDNNAYFMKRALLEHELTDEAGYQITMCKEQSNDAKELENTKDALLFLLPHPKYPQNKTVLDVKAREPKPLMDCNGIGCAVNDLNPVNKTSNELNFQTEINFKQ